MMTTFLPKGIHTFTDYMDSDGCGGPPVKIQVTITVEGDTLTADFTGTDPQCFGPANQTFGTTASSAYNAVLHMVSSDIPYNHGCYRAISVVAPSSITYSSETIAVVGKYT